MQRLRYFDTSYLIALIMSEPASDSAIEYVRRSEDEDQATSVWARVEFASALGARFRNKLLTAGEAIDAEQGFAELLSSFKILSVEPADFELAMQMLQDRSLGLRGGDALHVAIARNRDAVALLSLDKTMLRAARRLGAPASTGIAIPGYDA